MSQRPGAKKEIDPEELMKRKFRAKCLFRALGRLCMANTFWLMESVDEYEGVDDVKRRIEQAVRVKAKKQLLSIKDKALLHKPAQERTEHEKKYLYRIIGGLKCFKRYPNHVKRKLAAVTYFKYYGPNRVIVRQHQEAHALYFIVSGEVVVTQMIYDELLEEFVSTEVGTMGAGAMFGEVSLLHNIPRTASVMTTDHCEFLQLLKDDFKIILLTSVQKQWDEVKLAMMSFTYFEALDEVAFREGCIVAKMKKFAENETIYGDGVGIPNHVYFILTGRIQMIETLQVFVTSRLGKKYYALFDPYVEPEPSNEDFETKWFAAYKKPSESGVLPERNAARSSVCGQTTQSRSEGHGPSILKSVGSRLFQEQIGFSPSKVNQETTFSSKTAQPEGKYGLELINQAVGTAEVLPKVDKSEDEIEAVHRVPCSTQTIANQRPSVISALESGSKLILVSPSTIDDKRQSVRYSVLAPTESEVKKWRRGGEGAARLKTFFMQVCLMNPGSTFGFGENMRDRRIIALTPVSCMLMPKIWLLQHNTANIWTRIQYYLEKKIPHKQKLFEEFIKQQEWQEYKNQVVEDVIAHSKNVNYTSVHDVPYSIRLEEMLDI